MIEAFDTSGVVPECGPTTPRTPYWPARRWSDLAPFTQGYIEALLADLNSARMDHYRAAPFGSKGRSVPVRPAFSWLRPDTLARIEEDCRAAVADRRLAYHPTCAGGRLFYSERQKGLLNGDSPRFAPSTPCLGEDGRLGLGDAHEH